MSARFRWIVVAALLAMAMTVAACGDDDEGAATPASTGESSAASEPVEITVGYIPVGEQVLVKLADEQGIFEKHGVTVKYGSPAPTGAAQVGQLLNGQLDVGIGALTGVMSAVSENIPVRTVSALAQDFEADGQTAYTTIVPGDSDIESFKDLEGKSVAVNSLKGVWEVQVREAVAQEGGDPSKVKVTAIPFADQITALRQDRVDAIATLQPFGTQLEAQGFKNIGDAQATALGDPDSVASVTFMAKSFIDENPDAVEQWVAALSEASEYGNANPDEVREMTIAETKAPAELINEAPIPAFTTVIPDGTVEKWSELMIKYDAMQSPVSADAVLWEGVPRTEQQAQDLVSQGGA